LTSDQAEGENELLIITDGFILVRSSSLANPEENCNTTAHADAEFSGDSNKDQVQSTINEGRLEFAENPQMNLDEDPLQVNMNMVELEGKKVSLDISGRVDQGQEGRHRRRETTEDDQVQK
jgi:hypothetical protein